MNWKLPEVIVFSYPGDKSSFLLESLPVLFGTLVGGVLTIAMTLLFRWQDRRRTYVERDYELYLLLNQVINDVHALGSRYFEALEKHGWPIEPWTVMKPTIGETMGHIDVPSPLLMTLRGPHAQGLVHRVVELTNFRNIVVESNRTYVDLHTSLMALAAPVANVSRMRMQAALDPQNPDHRPIIVKAEQTADMAKQVLRLVLDFYAHAIETSKAYNAFRAKQQIRNLRSIVLDTSGIEAAYRFGMPVS
jgi:hypothetical protein